MWHRAVQCGNATVPVGLESVTRLIRTLLEWAALWALLLGAAPASALDWTPLNQGVAWTSDTRSDFYSRDQGSRLIPLAGSLH
jgi:hypothetical protein